MQLERVLICEPMPTLTLAAPLFALISERERDASAGRRSVSIVSTTWPAIAREMRSRFPALADRVLTETDCVRDSFALVVNDEVVSRNGVLVELGERDEVCLIAAIAGG
jgi:molybdopterin converting factor small subunit